MNRSRHIAIVVAAAFAACSTRSVRIVAVSPTQIAEHTTQSIAVNTEGCAPYFDLDRGRTIDPSAVLQVGSASLSFAATRTADESFSVALPDTIPPGTYPLELVLDDGDHARFDGFLQITPLPPVVANVASPRTTIGFGEVGLPLSITLNNSSLCAVDGLQVTPTFRQSASVQFHVVGPSALHLEPNSTAVAEFTVDVSAAAIAGPIWINATATHGARHGSAGCTGPVDASSAAHDAMWVVVPPNMASIAVTSLQLSPGTGSAGDTVMLHASLQNNAATSLTVDQLDPQSTPAGITLSDGSGLAQPIAAGATAMLHLHAVVPANAVAGTTYTFSVSVSAHDAGGTVYASAPGGATTTFTVR